MLRRRGLTAARHTYDEYQRKWDKWDNDDFVQNEVNKVDNDGEEDNSQGLFSFYAGNAGVLFAVVALITFAIAAFLRTH